MTNANNRTPNFDFELPEFGTRGWQDSYYRNWRAIDALVTRFFAIANYRGVWQNGTQYTEGDRVIDTNNATIYEALLSHVSSAPPRTFSEERSANPAFWQAFSQDVQFRGEWQSNTDYAAGDFVYFGQSFSTASTSHTSGTSYQDDLDTGLWAEVIDGQTIIGDSEDARDLARDWASLLSQLVASTDYSAKEYAIGDTVEDGSAKRWAQYTEGTVDDTEYSAKEYATGSPPIGSAKEWAQYIEDTVDGTDYSAKMYATGDPPTGSSQDWANKTGATVDGTEYSAKEYATGQEVSSGSAKHWADQAATSAQEAEDTLEDAIGSVIISETEPDVGQFRLWMDTSGTNPRLRQRNEANDGWVDIADHVGNEWRPFISGQTREVGTTAAQIPSNADLLSSSSTGAQSDHDEPEGVEKLTRLDRLAASDGFPFANMPTVDGNPIVESGSNSDGEWTRWADGTQTCWGSVEESDYAFDFQTTGNFHIGSRNNTINFPVAFIDSNISVSFTTVRRSGNSESHFPTLSNPINSGEFVDWSLVAGQSNSKNVGFTWIVFGRWLS